MKILFYINVLSNGGAERVMANLANGFIHDHQIIMVNSFSMPKEYPLNESIKHYYLEDTELKQGFLKKNAFRIRKLKEIIKTERPDITISFMAEPNFRLILANLFTKTKTIVSVRNDPNREYPNFLFKFLAKLLYRFADGIVFQTQDAQKWFPKHIQKKSVIIYNPVKDSFYCKECGNVNSGIVAVGRLTKQKNHLMLINAYEAIADKVEDDLFIYGEGELRKDLESRISELDHSSRVHLMGNQSDIESLIKDSKLFVMPSLYEGMPNSLMEAMALGLPCLSTDCPCGGPRELLVSDYLVPVGDQGALEREMVKICNNPDLLEQMSLENKSKAEQFQLSEIIKSWYAFIGITLNRQ